ncbi:hypothetical protein LCR77_004401 [Salmonella enterica]|nr:hypothetical protein [Salmonella enterica]
MSNWKFRKKEDVTIRGICVCCGIHPQKQKQGGKYRAICNFCDRRMYKQKLEPCGDLSKLKNDACPICGEESKLVIDHDHESGNVRGMICDSCNKMLGFSRDNPTILNNAITYLASNHV